MNKPESPVYAELLKNDGSLASHYLEMRGAALLPSNDFIRKSFDAIAPGKEIKLSSRDDARRSIVVTLPAILSQVQLGSFFERIGIMSGC